MNMITLTRHQAELAGRAIEEIKRLESLRSRPFKRIVRIEFNSVPSAKDPMGQGTELMDLEITEEMIAAELNARMACIGLDLAKARLEILATGGSTG